MQVLKRSDAFFSAISTLCGIIAAAAMILMLLNVFYDVVMRYVFNDVSIGMQELEWHLFSVVFLMGTPYAMTKDGHVRVDIFYEGFSDARKAWINLTGALLFVLPFTILVAWYGVDFSYQAYLIDEGSADPGGLSNRWLIKGLIPLSFSLMALAGLGMIVKALRVLIMGEHYDHDRKGGAMA
jgi:TRAP-type mannitol/chloroaromatic compound transport system permease small subunit